MKKKSLKIVIADPCHENWEAMSPTDQGRFCSSCSKPVIDFSSMSDLRLTEVLQEHKGRHMCGRFTESQLNRKLMSPLPIQKTSHLRAVLLGATLTSVFGLESCSRKGTLTGAYAIHETETEQMPVSVKEQSRSKTLPSGKKEQLVLSGMVTEDHSDMVLPNAKVVVFSQDRKELATSKTKKDGSFKLTLDSGESPSYIRVSLKGYRDRMVNLGDYKSMQHLVISLPSPEIMLKGDVRIIEE